MTDDRKVRAFDGRCTVFLASGIVISDLTEDAADAVMASFARAASMVHAEPSQPRQRVRREGRFSGHDARTERRADPERRRHPH